MAEKISGGREKMEARIIRDELMEVVGTDVPVILDADIHGHVIRLCHDAGTEFHRTLHMVLRAMWLGQNGRGDGLNDNRPETGETDSAEIKRRFNPDPGPLFELFESNARNWISGSGYDREMFRLLVGEMTTAGLFLHGGKSPEVDHYIDLALRQRSTLHAEGRALCERLMSAKDQWLRFQDELGERLLALERLRLRNAHIRRRWLSIFGAGYIRFLEEESRLEICRRKMLLLDVNPDLTAAGLEARLLKLTLEEKKRLHAVRRAADLSRLYDLVPAGKGWMDMEGLKMYRQDSKRILRELYLLIHPDVLGRNPAYERLTERQRAQLMKLWNEIMELKDEEIGFDESCIGYSYRNISILMDKLDLARAILQNAGIDIDPRLVIKGNNIPEQLEWLARSIKSLEAAILSIQAEQKVLLEDEEAREREAMLQWPGSRQEEIKAGYSRQADEYASEADKLDSMIREHLAGRK